MNGVEILAQNIIYEMGYYEWILIGSTVVGFLVGVGIAIYNWINDGFYAGYIALIILATFGGAAIGLIGYDASEHETDTVDHIEYKVTVSEDVNFTDFIDKYEILDQEGKIYTVKERE